MQQSDGSRRHHNPCLLWLCVPLRAEEVQWVAVEGKERSPKLWLLLLLLVFLVFLSGARALSLLSPPPLHSSFVASG